MKKIEEKKSIIDIKALIISIIIVAIIMIPITIILINNNKEKNEEIDNNVEIPSGCVACKSESGICCPYVTEESIDREELTELEIKRGCIECISFTNKCCPIKKEYKDIVEDGCITCGLSGEVCCPLDVDLTEEEIERGCYKTEEKGLIYCPV